MVAKSFRDSNMKVEPVIACGVVTYARRRYRQGEEIVAVNHKERKQLLDTVLAVEPNSEQGKKLKAKHADWLKTQPNTDEAAKKAADERNKRIEEQRKKDEEERKKAGEDKQPRGRGQTNRQQPPSAPAPQGSHAPANQQAASHAAAQSGHQGTPPTLRPAVGGLPPVLTDGNATPNSDTSKE